jgi:kynurenine formamidase
MTVPSSVPPLGDDELAAMFERCSNAGRWGPDDERGTLNYITPEKRRTASRLVDLGEIVSAGRDLSTEQTISNPRPLSHLMLYPPSGGAGSGDWFGIASHGMSVTHMDALAHISWEDRLYNGRTASQTYTRNEVTWGSIHAQREGIFTRGVLLDVAAARGVEWFEPDQFITVDDLEAAEVRENVRVSSGDALFVHTGFTRLEAARGEQAPNPRAGLHATCAEWMHQREVAVYGGDCIERLPYPSPRMPMPLHVLAIVAMGMPLLDWPALEELQSTCERLRRWEFLLAMAPLRLPGGTASPINPQCVF